MIGDTASISLLTGLPGAGKSLRMAEAISKLVEKGEHVFACNIDGLKIAGVTLWEDAKKWRELPPGSILFVDEAQAFFPERRGGDAPDFVRMNKIRHDGIRLVLATQQPNYLDTYLRGLVGYHEHLLRRSGKQESFLFRENQVMDVVRQKLATIKRNYDYEIYKFKPRYFACYDSAQTHQIKYQMPALVKRALMILPIAALLGVGAWYTVFRDSSLAQAAPAEVKAPSSTAPASAGAAGAERGRVQVKSAEGYVQSITPLVSDVPWSAPAYLDRPIVSDPHLYCMSTDNSCRCVTDQGTKPVVTVRDDVCRDIARWGEPYNPFKAPAGNRGEQRSDGGETRSTSTSSEGANRSQVQQSGPGIQGGIVSRQQRAMGSFPESPQHTSASYMTTPAIPSKL
ncbi:zonular occludens toxin domain-containing protein [uncultured Stenotrophomonas sp.]|uniref:zonular occludens toxin domain-containing protein n=1 Tax=uncultured Stenotrophomonas sp. TaxID=165438 RepID=UPI0025D9705D|nr:zonular occludens toxin domain-containing protein [uncultured Stenotrophomonas sp.]